RPDTRWPRPMATRKRRQPHTIERVRLQWSRAEAAGIRPGRRGGGSLLLGGVLLGGLLLVLLLRLLDRAGELVVLIGGQIVLGRRLDHVDEQRLRIRDYGHAVLQLAVRR